MSTREVIGKSSGFEYKRKKRLFEFSKMKFMKLGSKPDLFQTNGDNIRYVATELASDVIINIGDVKFYLHKFPLLSKSARLQKLAASTNEDTNNEIHLHDIPGGPIAFEICAKFCYGMTVTLNAYNVVAARCASEYLKMYETIEKGNLIYKIEVFLNSSLFHSWKDSIIVLQTSKSLLPMSEELKVVSHCLDSISTKASIDTSKVEWSYTYNRQKLPTENGNDDFYSNGTRQQQIVPKDWWVEDLCELQLDSYKQVLTTIKTKGTISNDVLGESLKAYTLRRLPGFNKGIIQGDLMKNQLLVESISWLLPTEKGTVPCSFLLMLLKAALLLECEEMVRRELIRRIGLDLDEVTMTDLLIRSPASETIMYDVAIVKKIVEEFMMQEKSGRIDSHVENEVQEIRSPFFVSDASKMRVAKLVDGYLTEIARDPNLPLLMFVNLAEMVSGFPRPSHDGLYRAIDMYLKGHPEISKSEKKRICRLMDCKKLSEEACTHAVQNERLPVRVVVQVLFFEQVRAASSSFGSATPDLPVSIKTLLPSGSHRSSRSTTTNTEEDWDVVVPIAEEIKALKGELASYKNINMHGNISKENAEKVDAASKMKNLVMSRKMFSKLWSNKDRSRDNSSSDTSGSTTAEEMKSTPSRSSRHSQS